MSTPANEGGAESVAGLDKLGFSRASPPETEGGSPRRRWQQPRGGRRFLTYQYRFSRTPTMRGVLK